MQNAEVEAVLETLEIPEGTPMVEVLNKVEPRFGSALMAYAWYRSEPLAGFDGRTAMQLVQQGQAQQVLDYIDAVDAGVYA